MTIDPLTIIHGDALSSLRTLPDESVQCCVTSPPYWGLRDYGVDKIVWDAAEGCDHQWGDSITVNATNHTDKRRWNHTRNGRDELQPVEKRVAWLRTVVDQGNVCELCGAWRGYLGLEPTPELYVSHVVEVFRELKRVLRSDGTLWLNLGDCYNAYNGGAGPSSALSRGAQTTERPALESGYGLRDKNLKPKDLVGIPWMVAFALRTDGWYLRSDIIWSKPNPMPESVTDRPTKSHEYLFLLSKSERYYYDAEAIKEPGSWPDGPNAPDKIKSPYGQGFTRKANDHGSTLIGGAYGRHYLGEEIPAKERRSDKQRGHSRRHAGFNDRWDAMERAEQCSGMRNKRSVWTIATRPFPEAHFATFPPDLVEPCILAGRKARDVVIDPFAGSGTTAKVAIELGRKAIAIEPKAEYVEMIKKRCQTNIGLPL